MERPQRGRGGSSGHGGRGGRGGSSSRGRGGFHHAASNGQPHAASSSPMFFPTTYTDTSTFQMPTSASASSSASAPQAQPQHNNGKPSRPPHVANPPRQQRHQHDEAKDDDESEETDEFEDAEDVSDYYEDEENIFDMAERAFADGQQQQAAKQQQPASRLLKTKKELQKLKQEKAQFVAARQPQQPQSSQRKQPLVVVTKQQREQQQQALLQQQQVLKAQLAALDNQLAAFESNQVQPPSQPQLSGDALTNRERRKQRAADKKQNTQQAQQFQQPPARATPAAAASHTQPQPVHHHQAQSQQQHGANKHNNAAPPARNNAHRGGARAATFFPDHLPINVMEIGIRQGLYLQGILRIVGSNAFVTVKGLARDLFIEGRKGRNRGYDGDVVCVQVIGSDTGVGTKQNHVQQQTPRKANNQAPSQQHQQASMQASLANLIISSELAEDDKIAAEKAAKENKATAVQVEDGDHDSSSSPLAPATPSSSLLAQLASAGPEVQHKGIVLGIMTSRFPVLNAPGLLKPYAEHLALFVPLDKKTPFAMVPERSWPEPFATEYRKHMASQAAKKAEKAHALKLRKQQGNFPASDQSSSDVLIAPAQEPEIEVDAMTAASDPNSVTLDANIYVATFAPWQTTDRQPFCTIARSLGLSGNISSETEALLVANGIDYDHNGAFSADVLAEVASYSRESENGSGGWQIPAAEIAKRRDMRDQTQWRIVSIDPTTARDLDDAIHIKDLGGDVVEIGVHIADVSHFVAPGTKLNEEACHRATTVYLVQKALPMLPPILCEQLCSLNPNVDRLAYSCIFYLSKSTGKILSDRKPWFGRTVIRTCCRLNYETAQLLMEFDRTPLQGRAPTEEDFTGELRTNMTHGHAYRPVDCVSIAQLVDDMQLLHRVSMLRRADRFEVGSLTLSNVKLQFETDKDRNPIGFYTYVIRDSNRVVEECMLLANLLVAHQCVTFCRNIALLRRHPPPNEKSMEKVSQSCRELGFDIDASTAGTLQRSLQAYEGMLVGTEHGVNDEVTTAGTVPIRQVLEPMCTRPMNLAVYFCTGTIPDEPNLWSHYALHFPEYTHFTSPIRRYADVIVHRVLTYSLELEAWQNSAASQPAKSRPSPPKSLSPDEVVDIADNCNTRKAAAKKAQEASSKVYLCDYLLRKHATVPLSASAVIVDMFSVENHPDPAFDILMPGLGIEKKIHLSDLLKQGKILAGSIEPKDAPEVNKQLPGNKNNRQQRRAEKQPGAVAGAPASASAPTVAPGSTAPILKSAKRLMLTWPDGTSNSYAIFDAISVELGVIRGPPMQLDAFVLSPAMVRERAAKCGAQTTGAAATSAVSSPPVADTTAQVDNPVAQTDD